MHARFEVFTVALLRIHFCWDVTLSLVLNFLIFKVTHCLHVQGLRYPRRMPYPFAVFCIVPGHLNSRRWKHCIPLKHWGTLELPGSYTRMCECIFYVQAWYSRRWWDSWYSGCATDWKAGKLG